MSTFAKEAVERAVKSAAQAAVGIVSLDGFNLLHVDWKADVAIVGGAFVLSLVTSVASLPFGQKGSPSVVTTEGASA